MASFHSHLSAATKADMCDGIAVKWRGYDEDCRFVICSECWLLLPHLFGLTDPHIKSHRQHIAWKKALARIRQDLHGCQLTESPRIHRPKHSARCIDDMRLRIHLIHNCHRVMHAYCMLTNWVQISWKLPSFSILNLETPAKAIQPLH